MADTLLCAIGNSGKHVWSVRAGGDVFLFRDAVAVVRTTAKETYQGLSGTAAPMKEAQQRRLRIKSRRPIDELRREHPNNRVIPRTAIKQVQLRRGLITCSMTLLLSDGETVRWVWSGRFSGASFEEVEAALREMVGSALVVQG